MGLIIMPQALKVMIPNIVGSFIGILKDTTLDYRKLIPTNTA